MKTLFKTILNYSCLAICLCTCKEDNPLIKIDYRDKWCGTYDFTIHYEIAVNDVVDSMFFTSIGKISYNNTISDNEIIIGFTANDYIVGVVDSSGIINFTDNGKSVSVGNIHSSFRRGGEFKNKNTIFYYAITNTSGWIIFPTTCLIRITGIKK